MTPNRPGRWALHRFDLKDIVIKWVDRSPEGELLIVWEDGWDPQLPYPSTALVRLYTEFISDMGWGEWVDRVGDLPPIPSLAPRVYVDSEKYVEWMKRTIAPREFWDVSTR